MKACFDKLIAMPLKAKVISLVFFIVMVFLIIALVGFTGPPPKMDQYPERENLLGFLFIASIMIWVVVSKWLMMDPKTLGFRQIVIDNFITVCFLLCLSVLLNVTIVGFIVTGKVCLFFNQGCIN